MPGKCYNKPCRQPLTVTKPIGFVAFLPRLSRVARFLAFDFWKETQRADLYRWKVVPKDKFTVMSQIDGVEFLSFFFCVARPPTRPPDPPVAVHRKRGFLLGVRVQVPGMERGGQAGSARPSAVREKSCSGEPVDGVRLPPRPAPPQRHRRVRHVVRNGRACFAFVGWGEQQGRHRAYAPRMGVLFCSR